MIDVLEIRRTEQLADCRLLWTSLLGETRGATFYHSLDWLEDYWRRHADTQRPRVLVARCKGRPLGILPLTMVYGRARPGRRGVLAWPLVDGPTLFGPIGPNATATLLIALRYLRQSPRDWDAIDLEGVDVDGHDRGRTERALRQAGFAARKRLGSRSAAIDLNTTCREYLAARPEPLRHRLVRAIDDFDRAAGFQYVHHRPDSAARGDGDPNADLHRQCKGLFSGGEAVAEHVCWSDGTDGASLDGRRRAELLDRLHTTAARQGALDVHALSRRGRVVAAAYNYHYAGHVSNVVIAHRPDGCEFSPRHALLGRMVRRLVEVRDHTLDLGPAGVEDRRHWLTGTRTGYRYTHYASAGRARWVRMADWTRRQLSGSAGAAAQ